MDVVTANEARFGCGLLIACVTAIACNALSGADALESNDRGASASSSSGGSSGSIPTGTTTSSSGDSGSPTASSSGTSGSSGTSTSTSSTSSTSSSSSSGTTSSSSGSSGATDGGVSVLIDETFDANSCNSWTATNGVIAWDGMGGCLLCATATTAIYMEKTVTTPVGGSASMVVWAKRRAGTSAPTSAVITLKAGGSSIAGSGSITETSMKLSGATSVTVQAGVSVTPRIGMSTAAVGDCLVVDAVRVITE